MIETLSEKTFKKQMSDLESLLRRFKNPSEFIDDFEGKLMLIGDCYQQEVLIYSGDMEIEARHILKGLLYVVRSRKIPPDFALLLENVQEWNLDHDSKGDTNQMASPFIKGLIRPIKSYSEARFYSTKQ